MRGDYLFLLLLLSTASVAMLYFGSQTDTTYVYDTASNLQKRFRTKLEQTMPACCKALTKECLSCAAGMLVHDFCDRHKGEYGCTNVTVTPPPDQNICCQDDRPLCKACQQGIDIKEYLKRQSRIPDLYKFIKNPKTELCNKYHVLKGENSKEPDVRICLDDITPPCNVISIGIAYNFIFDDFMLKHGCRVWSYDPSMKPGNYKRHERHEFFPIGIGSANEVKMDRSTLYKGKKYSNTNGFETKTLETMINDMGISYVDVLRVDTEGAEWDIINTWDYNKIGQLLIEIHMWKDKEMHARKVLDIPYGLFWSARNLWDNGKYFKDMTRVYELGFLKKSKKKNICIVTGFKKSPVKEYYSWASYEKIIPYTLSNMWQYSKRHGYNLYAFNEDIFDIEKKASWAKIPLYWKYRDTCEWIFYTDIDFLFTNFEKPIPVDNKYEIILSHECIAGHGDWLMPGTMLLHSSKWTDSFMKKWADKYKDYKNVDNHDAMAFIHMLKTPPKEVKVLPPRDFMTYDRHNCVKPTFGIHFPAHDKATRVKNWIKKHKMKIQTGTNTVAIAGKNIYYQIPFNMPSSKIVIGVLSSKKNKRMAMRKIYKNENIYFIIGKKNGAFDYDEFYEFNDMIFVDMEEAYMGEKSILPYKTQTFLHVVETHVDSYDYILKLDDDSLVKIESLTEELQIVKPDYWGRVWYKNIIDRNPRSKWYVSRETYPESRYPDYCSGAGYVVSKKANECIVTKLAGMKFMPREDVATGILAKACSITPVNSNRVQHMKPYPNNDYIIRHYVKMEEISSDWCKTHDVLPNGAFCNKKYAGMDMGLAKAIVKIIPTGSTISDLGAGGGWYTDYFNTNGMVSTAYDASPVRPAHVQYIDLIKPVKIPQRDWIVSLEVGEHLPKQFEKIFLNNLIHGNNVILSWAIPGQGGNNHVNLRPNNYIIKQMKHHGFEYQPIKSKNLRSASTFSWFKNTLMVFQKKTTKFLKHSYSGGQGNRIWQYLSLSGIAEKKGFQLCGDMPDITLMEIEPYEACPEIEFNTITEINRRVLTIPNTNTEIKGYLQYKQYFGKQTIENLQIKKEHLQQADKILRGCSEWIGLHVRVFPSNHPDIKLNHHHAYNDILHELKTRSMNACLYVASNDMTKVNKNYAFKKTVYSSNSADIDLAVLTKVNHLVVSSGSFAYIAAVKNIYQNIYFHKDQKYLMGYDKINPPKHWNKWGFKSYSQAKQDIVTLALSYNRNNGYFVEIGANDGKTFSNTLMLENMGWRGLLIEADPSLCKKYKRAEQTTWYCGCLSNKDSVMFSSQGTLGHISETGKRVPCKNPSIFTEDIDFFSLDVEGAELDILNLMKPYLVNSSITVNMWSIEYRIWDNKIFYEETMKKLQKIREFFDDVGGYTEYGALSNKPMNGLRDGLDIVFLKNIIIPKNTKSVQINIGSNTDPIHGKNGAHTIIYEPIVPQEAADFAMKNDIKYGGTSKVYPFAVSNYTGTSIMYKYNDKGMSSSFSNPANKNYWNSNSQRGDGEQIQVKVISFETILKSISQPISYLKTDMQGYDFAALSSAGELLYKLEKIQTEVYTGGSTYKNVQNDMCADWLPFMKRWGWKASNFNGDCNTKRELDIIWEKNN